MERQYIGARYVPKFYEGTNGTEWDANHAYERLTIVTFMFNSYTSKKDVPASVGDPMHNPEYWAATGNYNAQVEAYREEVNELIDGMIVTPEMYGAIGDGITDDKQAVLDAINTEKYVYFAGTYYIGSKITLSNKNVHLFGCGTLKFDQTSDMFDLTACVFEMNGITIHGNGEGIIFNSTGTEYNLTDVSIDGTMSVMRQETAMTSGAWHTKFTRCSVDVSGDGIIYYGSEYVDVSITDCKLKAHNMPYFISHAKYASVVGGDISSDDGSGMCNLYSCEYATISDGFYHNMVRGATVGGKSGKCASIIGTKNTDVSFSGISVDYATEREDPYTEGKTVVMGNLIESDKYGIYIQGRRVSVIGNQIYCRDTSSALKYGIRLNCVEGSNIDYGNVIADNIIDCNNNAYTFPIYLSANAVAHIKNNTYVNTVLNPSGEWESYNIYDDVLTFDENSYEAYDSIGITNKYGVYICTSLDQNRNIYLPTWGASSNLTDNGRTYKVINLSSHTITLNKKGSATSIYSNTTDNYIPSNSMGTVTCLGGGKWVLEVTSLQQVV